MTYDDEDTGYDPIGRELDKWCRTCQRPRRMSMFRKRADGTRSKKCVDCEANTKPPSPLPRRERLTDHQPLESYAQRPGVKAVRGTVEVGKRADARFPGVDIDRIYRTRPDLVRKS